MRKIIFCGAMFLLAVAPVVRAQKTDDERMNRDVEVAENVLATLFKQESDRSFFYFNDIEGNYVPGYGVIFSVPGNGFMLKPDGPTIVWTPSPDFNFDLSMDNEDAFRQAEKLQRDGERQRRQVEEAHRQAEVLQHEADRQRELTAKEREKAERQQEIILKDKPDKIKGKVFAFPGFDESDSARQASRTRVLEVMKTFLADYGDILSQLPENEKILVTNKPSGAANWGPQPWANRSLVSAEVSKSDLTRYRQGQINRDELLSRMVTVNAESMPDASPDMETFATILNSLYRPDLSKTYFMNGDVYYERLKDFGVIYYMQVFSSNKVNEEGNYRMPTAGGASLSEEERNKKVTAMYPQFEREAKENMLDYGRTIKSLGEKEKLIMNIRLTRCGACGIPSTLELSVTGSVLQQYNAGKLDKSSALNQIFVKKGAAQ